MIAHREYAQNSLEWLAARAGIPTASEFDQLLNHKFEVRKGAMPQSYIAKKVAEAWSGSPSAGYMSIDMEAGHILEEEAKPWYALEYGQTIDNVAFVTTDDGRVGCSPDGLLGDDGGIEIKAPLAHTHTRYLLDGTLPADYAAQVHGSMYVTGRPWWKFLSYRRHFPPLLLTIERDEKIQAAIGEALELFLMQFSQAMKRLVFLNGGPKLTKTLTDLRTVPAFRNSFSDDVIP